MTKRRPKKHKSAMYSIVDGVAVDVPHSATILLTGSPDEDTYLALQEQRYEMLAGRDAIAKSLAAELRREIPPAGLSLTWWRAWWTRNLTIILS